MEFKLSVFMVLTIIIVGSSAQRRQLKNKYTAEDVEQCFKEVNITDPKLKAEVSEDIGTAFEGRICFLKCIWVANGMVDEDGVIKLKSYEAYFQDEKDIMAVKKCQQEAKKKKSEGPCEVFMTGYKCLFNAIRY